MKSKVLVLKKHLINQNFSKDNNSSFSRFPIKNNLEKVKRVLGSVEFKNSVIIFNKSDLKNSKQKFKEWKIKIPAIKNFKSMTISCKNNTKNQDVEKVSAILYR